jgi:hypothetical protein
MTDWHVTRRTSRQTVRVLREQSPFMRCAVRRRPTNESSSFGDLLTALKREPMAAEAAVETFPRVVEARKWLERCER